MYLAQGKRICLPCRRCRFRFWVGKIPMRRKCPALGGGLTRGVHLAEQPPAFGVEGHARAPLELLGCLGGWKTSAVSALPRAAPLTVGSQGSGQRGLLPGWGAGSRPQLHKAADHCGPWMLSRGAMVAVLYLIL